jgi:hypothetical protein
MTLCCVLKAGIGKNPGLANGLAEKQKISIGLLCQCLGVRKVIAQSPGRIVFLESHELEYCVRSN